MVQGLHGEDGGMGQASNSAGRRQTLRNVCQCSGLGPGWGGHHWCALIPGSWGWVGMAGTVWLMAVRERGLGRSPSFSAAHSDLTSRRQEKACPLGRTGLGLGVALCRAALHPQDCQGQQPKPLPKCQHDASRLGQRLLTAATVRGRTVGLQGRGRAHPVVPSLSQGSGVEPDMPRLHLLSAVHNIGRSELAEPSASPVSGMKQHRACPCLSHLPCEGLIS